MPSGIPTKVPELRVFDTGIALVFAAYSLLVALGGVVAGVFLGARSCLGG